MMITLDFETYYDADISLTKMSTSEYIRHEEFKTHMVGVKVDADPVEIMTPGQFKAFVATTDWSNAELLCHHTAFDGFILQHHYGARPLRYLDTLSMARAGMPGLSRYDLSTVSKALGGTGKLEGELVKTKGVRDLDAGQFHDLSIYCAHDVNETYAVFQALKPSFPEAELQLIDLTIRMFCEPVLRIDTTRVAEERAKEIGGKTFALMKAGVLPDELISNNKLAKLLEANGVVPPVKISPSTGDYTFAFSKNDVDFKALLHHPNEKVKRIVEARIKLKSSIGESRADRFLEEGKDGNLLPVYLNYYGAHTGRWSGGNKMNLQNLPRGGELRKSILAPDGHVLCVVDSSQIEARCTAWLAGETSLLDGFRSMVPGAERDVYTAFASEVYKRDITTADKVERFVGKTCILGLGFGMGATRLRETLLVAGIDLPHSQCRRIVNLYRDKYKRIPALWEFMNQVIDDMAVGRKGQYKCIKWGLNRIQKPSGMLLYYKNLRRDPKKPENWIYDAGRSMPTVGLYGAIVTENVVQGALGREIVAEQMLEIAQRYRVVMMSHDEVGYLAPIDEADEAVEYGVKVMSTPPKWAPDIPVNAVGGHDVCYSK